MMAYTLRNATPLILRSVTSVARAVAFPGCCSPEASAGKGGSIPTQMPSVSPEKIRGSR